MTAQAIDAMLDDDGSALLGSAKARTMGLGGDAMPDAATARFNRRMHDPGSA